VSDQGGAAPVAEGGSARGEDELHLRWAEAPAATAEDTSSRAAGEEPPTHLHETSPEAEEVDQPGSGAGLPDVTDGPALEGAGPAVQRHGAGRGHCSPRPFARPPQTTI
jgi:hypothetical protein